MEVIIQFNKEEFKEFCRRLDDVLEDDRVYDIKFWIDQKFGGLKFKVNDMAWSPPLGNTIMRK